MIERGTAGAVVLALGLAACSGGSLGSDGSKPVSDLDATPTWSCAERSTFTPVGQPIGGDAGASRGRSRPEDVAASAPGGRRVELDRTSTEVVFGYLDEDGALERRVEVRKDGDGWVLGPSTECDDGSSGEPQQFETVGSSISNVD